MSGYATVNENNNIIDDFLDIFKKFYNSVKNRFTKNDEISFEDENEYGIQDNIGQGPCQSGYHGKSRAAIRTDHRIHSLSEHIKRDTQCNIEKVFFGVPEGLRIHCSPKHSQ